MKWEQTSVETLFFKKKKKKILKVGKPFFSLPLFVKYQPRKAPIVSKEDKGLED